MATGVEATLLPPSPEIEFTQEYRENCWRANARELTSLVLRGHIRNLGQMQFEPKGTESRDTNFR